MKKTCKPLTATAMTLATGLMLAVTSSAWAEGMSDSSGVSGSSGMSNNQSANGSKLTPSEQKTFSRLDTNGDGKISQIEAKKNPALAAKFSSVDKDNNHVVDEGEFAQFETETQHK